MTPATSPTVSYFWVVVKPNGSGWSQVVSMADSAEYAFPENKLDTVLELFYENVGPYPFDFSVMVVTVPEKKTARKRPAKKRRRTT